MIYVLGGTARSGKTTTARLFTEHTGISRFSADVLKMGLVRGAPEFGVDVYDDAGTAVKLWPILRGMMRTCFEEQEDVLFEGYYLLPDYVAELRQDLGDQLRACFLGFCDVDTETKIAELRQHSPGGWTSDDDDEAVRMAEKLKDDSRRIRDDCARLGFRYFDNNTDHFGTLDSVVKYLSGGE